MTYARTTGSEAAGSSGAAGVGTAATEADAMELEAKLWRVLSASEPVADAVREAGAGTLALAAALDDDVETAGGRAAGTGFAFRRSTCNEPSER